MSIFYNSPILIKDVEDQNRTIGMIPTKQYKQNVSIQISTLDDVIIATGTSGSNLSIPLNVGSITITYIDLTTNRVLDKESHILNAYTDEDFNIDFEKTDMMYKDLVLFIKNEMDNPKLSDEERETHTENILNATSDEAARNYVYTKIFHLITQRTVSTESEARNLADQIYAELYGMGILQELDDDVEVGEIMINGFTVPTFRAEVYYIKNQKKYKLDKEFKSFQEMNNVFKRAIAFSKKELNQVENARLEAVRSNGDRVNIIIPDASTSYIMNIRKFGNFVPDKDTMKKSGTVNEEMDELFNILVQGKANIGIGGEMGTGKTTFINYCLTHTEPIERKVVISSVPETDVERTLKGHDILILNVDEQKGFTFDSQIRASLRTTASRVIIPESRGSEFKQVYEANLKTKGNMFTAHALDDVSFLDMCVDMYLGDDAGDVHHIRNKVAKSLDIIVIMQKVGDTIRIKSISEVVVKNNEYHSMRPLYYWKRDPENPNVGEYSIGEKMTDDLINRLNEYGVPLSQINQIAINKKHDEVK